MADKTEWRECPFVGVESCKGNFRRCEVPIVGEGPWVNPGHCATCPVPALVEAVRYAIKQCSNGPGGQTCVGCAALPENAVDDEAVCPYHAALALLPEAK